MTEEPGTGDRGPGTGELRGLRVGHGTRINSDGANARRGLGAIESRMTEGGGSRVKET